MNKTLSIVTALALAGMAVAADAADCDCGDRDPIAWHAAWYAGASASESTFREWSVIEQFDDGSFNGDTEDDRSTGYRAFAGFEFLRYLGVEAGYGDYGEASFAAQSDGSGSFWDAGPVRDHVELQGLDLSLLARAPLPRHVALVAQLGVMRWQSDASASGYQGGFLVGYDRERQSGVDALYGGRLEYDGLRSLRLALAYTRSNFDAASHESASLQSLTLSAAYRF